MASGRLSKVKGKVLDIPNPPTIGTATAGGESVSIAFTADSSGKGGPTRSYIAKSNPGNITATGSTSPISVTGLTVGTSYTISVAGVNEFGTGEYSSASGSAVPIVATAYESIATVTVGSGGQSTISFTSIPSTYKHLQLRVFARDSRTPPVGVYNNMQMQVGNGSIDTGTNYTYHTLQGNGSAASADGAANSTSTDYTLIPSVTAQSGVFSALIVDILDYADTNKNKTIRMLNGVENNASATGFINLSSSVWRNTSAITDILFKNSGANNFVQYSQFALYGIRGS